MSKQLNQRIQELEQQIANTAKNTLQIVQNLFKSQQFLDVQEQAYHSIRIGLCVNTADPFAQGRVQFYLPGLTKKDTPVGSLPWAYPVATLGGFDDSGGFWVPPAGSALVLIFENGDKGAPYYIGTTWKRNRGAAPHNWGYGVPEFEEIHAGHRKGYLVNDNEEMQVFPPNNTDNYNIPDYDNVKNFETNTDALKKVVPSHSYRFKSPQKHFITLEDGNYKCNHRWKRVEIGSSCGHIFMMYDDHMHAAGQHANPQCQNRSTPSGSTGTSPDCIDSTDCQEDTNRFQNTLFKPANECRAFSGPGTPQNNKCELDQTGIFMASISGHMHYMDDKVTQPQGIPNWERGIQDFDFGCEDIFAGKMGWKSATGVWMEMNDLESESGIRSGEDGTWSATSPNFNGWRAVTPMGNSIQLNDHTLQSRKAGSNRGIRIQSSSTAMLEMIDDGNDQTFEDRREGAEPIAKAKNAYVRLKSGYGLQLLFRDDNSQDGAAEAQFIELTAPQKQNSKGPHILRMSESPPDEPGLVLLRVGGMFVGTSTDQWVVEVGKKEEPANMVKYVSGDDVGKAEKYYVRENQAALHYAKEFIILAAGEDCPDVTAASGLGPCVLPVIVDRPRMDLSDQPFWGNGYFTCPFTQHVHISREQGSDRVFASASLPPAP